MIGSMSVSKAIGRIANERGERHERWALEAVCRVGRTLAWFVSARRANKQEDRTGIDIVIATSDIGPLFLQVKSSRYRATQFGKTKRKLIIEPVVACVDDRKLDARVAGSLARVRARVLSARSG